jgi:hypothetical protein
MARPKVGAVAPAIALLARRHAGGSRDGRPHMESAGSHQARGDEEVRHAEQGPSRQHSGNAANASGSGFNPNGTARVVYAGNPGTASSSNANSSHAMSQYDIACFQQTSHEPEGRQVEIGLAPSPRTALTVPV